MFIDFDIAIELELIVHGAIEFVCLINLSSIRANMTQCHCDVTSNTAVLLCAAIYPFLDVTTITSCVVEHIKIVAETKLWLVAQMSRDLNLRCANDVL